MAGFLGRIGDHLFRHLLLDHGGPCPGDLGFSEILFGLKVEHLALDQIAAITTHIDHLGTKTYRIEPSDLTFGDLIRGVLGQQAGQLLLKG